MSKGLISYPIDSTAASMSSAVISSHGFLWVMSSTTPSEKHHSSGISSIVLEGSPATVGPKCQGASRWVPE